jgi:hypothetical protein
MPGLAQIVCSAAYAQRRAPNAAAQNHCPIAPRKQQGKYDRSSSIFTNNRSAVTRLCAPEAGAGATANELLDDDQDEDAYSEHDELEESTDISTPAVVILAGFYVEELPGVRHLLDQADGHHITLVPCLPEYLSQPLAAVLQLPEPAWEEPVPTQWVDGGGWGRQRTVLFSGLAAHAQAVILELLEESRIGDVCALAPGPDQGAHHLGDVMAAAVAAQRNRGKGIEFAAELGPVEHFVPAAEQQAVGGALAEEAYAALEDADLGLIDLLAAASGLAEPAPAQSAAAAMPPATEGISAGHAAPAEQTAPAASPEQARHVLSGNNAQAEGATLPNMDQFVLNKAQLLELSKEAGVDYATLLAGLHQRGIELEG